MASDATSSAGGAVKIDRLPPHSEEAERGVLGSALIDGGRIIDLCVQRQVSEDAFYIPAHRLLFTTLIEMGRNNEAIDLLTVSNRLRDSGQLDRVGGSVVLDRLVDATPTSAHAEYYINIVRQKFLLRSIIARARAAESLCFDPDKSPDELLGEIEQSFFDIRSSQREELRAWDAVLKDVIALIDKISTTGKGVYGIPTGYNNIDSVLGGMRPNQLIVLAARPSMGKTSLAMNIAENVADGFGDPEHVRRPVGIFSIEMSCEDLAMRMICGRARVRSDRIWSGFISNEHHQMLIQAVTHLGHAPLFIDDSAGLDVTELRARARRMKAKHDIQMVVIDYLQMLSYGPKSREGRQVEVAAVSGQLKAMAKELKIPVLVLSQLSRAPEGRDEAEPQLSDLRDSGAIEQDADVVMLLRRPCRIPKSKQHEDQTLAIINIAKNRNGRTDSNICMNFLEEYTLFQDRAKGDMDPAPMVAADESEEQ